LHWFLEGDNHRRKNLEGLAIGLSIEEIYYIDLEKLSHVDVLKLIKPILEEPAIKKVGHDMKELLVFLKTEDVQILNIGFDTYIAAYILEPSESKYDIY